MSENTVPAMQNTPQTPPYLNGLNDMQLQAVQATEGPLLVLAGAGTGKTKVLTTRAAHILSTGLAHGDEVLAVTFTNRAAREMRERVESIIGPQAQTLWLGTFHSIAVKILRVHAERVGLTPDFTILDADDQLRLIKQILEAAGIDQKASPPRLVSSIIQRWKDRALKPQDIEAGDGGRIADGKMRQIYAEYQQRLRTLNAADFGDLILHCVTLFLQHDAVAKHYQNQFRYILVDEYQDTNVAQYMWLRLLAQQHKNLCCVGDDDQSIYSWRGAEVGNILRFEQDFDGSQVIRLEQNYRSTPHILSVASRLIAHNESRLGKELWTDRDGGEKIIVYGVQDGQAEARFIGEQIENHMLKKHVLNEMAVLVRAGFQTREFEERLITMGIPYRVIGGPRFYERQEIKDAIAYLRVIAQPQDGLAFERIVNVPKRGIGKTTIQNLHHIARSHDCSIVDAAGIALNGDGMRAQTRIKMLGLLKDFERWRSQAGDIPHHELAEIVLEESGYVAMWQEDKSPDAPGRLDNLKELIRAMEEFDSLRGFLEHVSLVMENNENSEEDQVNLMTLHSAKGLEFDTVFLPGWEEGLFPHQRSIDDSGVQGLEEERRLAFVGITRAKERAFITYAQERRIHNNWVVAAPSRFIKELPEDEIEHENLLAQQYYVPTQYNRGGQQAGFNQRLSGPKSKAWQPQDDALSDFSRGERVYHEQFGYGVVQKIEGDRLNIIFEDVGIKKVIDRFVAKID